MGLDVWFKEDVARVLRAAYIAGKETYLNLGDPSGEEQQVFTREMAAYWRGYQAALATVAAAFGTDVEV